MTETTQKQDLDTLVQGLLAKIDEKINEHFETRDALDAERMRKEANQALEKKLEDWQKANPSFALPGLEVTDKDGKKEAFSIARACVAIATKDWTFAPYEKEVFDEMRRKDLTLGTPSAGGYTVPENYSSALVEYLYNNTVAFKLGAQRLDGIGRGTPLHIPKLTGSATGYWIATEGTTITPSSQSFGQLELTPHTLAAYVEISNLLLENSAPVADQIVTNDLQMRLGVSLDAGILNGSGGSGQPTGMLQTGSINTYDFSTGTATYDSLATMVHRLAEDNALRGKLGWAMNPRVFNDIMTMKDATQEIADGGSDEHIVNTQPLARRVISDGAPERILGYQYEMTNTLPSTEAALIFANWNEVFVPVWKAIELRASDTAKNAFENDELHVRAIMRCDVGVRHPESICGALNYAA